MNVLKNLDRLKQVFDTHKSQILELGFEESNIEKLWQYVVLLWTSNEELNLFSRQMTEEELILNHIIDCLLPLKYLPNDLTHMADLGSGGGMPGVIYALHLPKTKYLLFEKSVLKQNFLKKCVSIAPNLSIQSDVPHDLDKVQLVTARAFKPLDVILDMTRIYYQKGGKYFLLKARAEKINEELNDSLKKFKNLKSKIIELKSPVLDVERHVVLINEN